MNYHRIVKVCCCLGLLVPLASTGLLSGINYHKSHAKINRASRDCRVITSLRHNLLESPNQYISYSDLKSLEEYIVTNAREK